MTDDEAKPRDCWPLQNRLSTKKQEGKRAGDGRLGAGRSKTRKTRRCVFGGQQNERGSCVTLPKAVLQYKILTGRYGEAKPRH